MAGRQWEPASNDRILHLTSPEPTWFERHATPIVLAVLTVAMVLIVGSV